MDIWDSLRIRHQQEEAAYNMKVKNELQRTDTLTTGDSMVVSFISKKDDLLKKIVYQLDAAGCAGFVRFKYYNEKGQVAYIRKFKQSCVPNIHDQEFNHIYYERFEYDISGRLIVYIDTFADRPYKVEYTYTPGEAVKRVSKKISETDFWKSSR
ncbi:MAG TPA: hypothetical protein VGO58_04415 [Chitinophagaceae bacterium]|jgi:hypothetical protein|nr:hypothetical protein [Chitinophagaceae bacterium]